MTTYERNKGVFFTSSLLNKPGGEKPKNCAVTADAIYVSGDAW